jgi:hypothetical protein
MGFSFDKGNRHLTGMAPPGIQVLVFLGVAFGLGCTGGRDSILGWNGDIALLTIPPQVTITVPVTSVPEVTGVSTGIVITATFTKAMAPATINPASFTVTGPDLTVVAGSVTYVSRTALFTPTFALAGETPYIVTIFDTATDTSGNALAGNQAPLAGASNYVWTFTTGPAAPPIQPNLGVVQAFGQIQAAADGSLRNDGVAGEPVPAQAATDATKNVKVRHGFYLPLLH